MKKAAIARKKTPSLAKKNQLLFVKIVLILGFFVTFFVGIYQYRNAILYYLCFKTNKTIKVDKVAQSHIYQVLNNHETGVAGIDISQYQGNINWEKVDSIGKFKLHFVFIRATVGTDKADEKFKFNWIQSKKHKFLRGAYHYYRPDENSKAQALNFINQVCLKKGDFPPVLDIEKLPENQSMEKLKEGLKNWLQTVEQHYKVKPIIYSGEKYYEDFLKKEFSDYSFWVANYNFWVTNCKDDWLFWQFSEKASISGIDEQVDLNIYNGSPKMLQYLTNPN